VSVVIHDNRSLLRISVQSEGRRLDIGVPAQLPLIEVMPGFARSLGVLDPTMTHVGYGLQRSSGELLDPSRGAGEQGVQDGELLTLARGQFLTETRLYDDIVEAVIDATKDQHKPWTSADNTRTALSVALSLIGICLMLLIMAGPGIFGALIACGSAVILLAASSVLTRLGITEPGLGLGFAAAASGATAGYLAVPAGETLWGWPLAAAALGGLVVSGTWLALAPAHPDVQVIPAVVGITVGVPAGVSALHEPISYAAYAVTLAVVASAGAALPWLAMTTQRLKVISPQSESEIFATPSQLDTTAVRTKAMKSHRTLTSLRFAVGLTLLILTPLVASGKPLGGLLAALAFLGFMFPARQSYSRSAVLLLMAMGTSGLALSGVVVAITQPALREVLLGLLATAAVLVVALTLISPKTRLRLSTLSDTVELCLTAALLPLSVIAAGVA